MNAMLERARRKRGIVLLVVISLLTLFILLGVTYTLVATQYRDAATSESRRELYGDNPETEMDMVLGQLLYDSLVRTSLQGHSMLGDLYGNDGVAAKVTTAVAATSPANSGIMTLDLDGSVLQPFGGSLSNIPDYYNGRVLTFTTGSAKGVSARIMHYVPGTPPKVVVETAEGVAAANLANSQVLINGAPFNGTGAGYEDATKKPELKDAYNQLVALMPHYSGYYSTSLTHPVNYGGEDETWDAVDYNNMFLAMVPPTALADSTVPILPSFHRPELIRYWANQTMSGWAFDPMNPSYKDFRRQIVMRPMPWDHPNFTGSNPAFVTAATPTAPTQAEDDAWVAALQSNRGWDVDNDNDGIADSIWIDPGLPVLTSPSGRRFKRLAAILIKDMDGRINMNTASNLKVAEENNLYQSDTDISAATLAGQDPNAPANVKLARGIGYGPAETDMLRILTNAGDNSNYLTFIRQRYGANNLPGVASTDDQVNMRYKAFDIPSGVGNHTATRSPYLSMPPDVWGRSAVGIDYYGQPSWANDAGKEERMDDPYEMQVDSRTAYADNPYTIAELERLLRYNDPDAPTISSRLNISPFNATTNAGVRARESVTTAAWHVSGTSMIAPKELRTAASTNAPRQGSILDLYVKKGLTDPNNWLTIVPFEIRHGEPFNLNRLFGDGADGAPTNSVIDEPGETEPAGAAFTNDSNFPGDNPATNPYAVRQMYARHLYCLAMMLKNPQYDYDDSLDADTNPSAAETARALAQWAINVVDFRDADCIMTPFNYDPNPFDGWTDANNGIPDQNNPNIVWGCERPELLITETIAGHDRRTEDTDLDEPDKKKTDATNNPDDDFDQRLRPSGFLFIELYNPWFDRTDGQYSQHPNELYHGEAGVKLNAVSPAGNSPVWRLIIDRRAAADRAKNPDEPRPETLTGAAAGTGDIERSVYFTNPGATPAPGGETYYSDVGNLAPLKPGRYALIGSSGIANAGKYTTYVGRVKGESDLASAMAPLDMDKARQIVLQPNVNPDLHQVQVLNNGNTYDMNASTDIQPAIAIPINQPRSLNITEPIGGYAGAGYTSPPSAGAIADAAGVYEPPLDEPLDKSRTGYEFLMQDGTSQADFRTIHLQRLANPLLAHDQFTNPYITIDSQSVDVTAFNGVSDPKDPGADANHKTNFQTVQRGGSFPDSDTPGYVSTPDPTMPNPAEPIRNIWKRAPSRVKPTADSTAEAGTPHYFGFQLFHTFGYLNRQYHPYLTSMSGVAANYVGAPSFQNGAMTTGPAFPWLNFNNRPFANPMELMLVPRYSQYDLLTYQTVKTPAMTASIYDNANLNQPFGHLLNLFQSSTDATVESGMTLGPQLNRLFDYVEVPSPFMDTERWFPATTFTASAAPAPSPAQGYRPPFSSLSRHREPGRVNINTIFDDQVFYAAVAGIPQAAAQATWQSVVLNRQGYGASAFATDNAFPSYFSQPFRTADAADMMPLPNSRVKSIDATLLREDRTSTTTPKDPLFKNSDTSEHVNVDRNPYFRYQGFQKIGNTFTTHSNVFAVWMTIGYFEVEDNGSPVVVDAGHPDGYRLGMELGADTGEIQRHRSFFIIDRSIPVAYQPGQRHNTDRAVLLRRFIE
jgi:hypothetical protein